MSYCVNCGVELGANAGKCPLCSTPVINPSAAKSGAETSPFGEKTEIPAGVKRRFIAFIITMIMLLPNIVLLLVNIFFVRSSWWSVYVISTTALVWIYFVLPFILKRPSPYVLWALDSVASAAYAYVFFVMNSNEPWMFGTVYSAMGVVILAALIFIIWIRRRKHHWTSIVSHILIDLTAVSLLAGLVSWLLSGIFTFFAVGLICSACFLSLTGFFLYCNRSAKMREWFRKAFYI